MDSGGAQTAAEYVISLATDIDNQGVQKIISILESSKVRALGLSAALGGATMAVYKLVESATKQELELQKLAKTQKKTTDELRATEMAAKKLGTTINEVKKDKALKEIYDDVAKFNREMNASLPNMENALFKVRQLQGAFAKFASAVEYAVRGIADQVLINLEAPINRIIGKMTNAANWIRDNLTSITAKIGTYITAFAKGVIGIAESVEKIFTWIGELPGEIQGVGTAIMAVFALLKSGPIGQILAVVSLIGDIIHDYENFQWNKWNKETGTYIDKDTGEPVQVKTMSKLWEKLDVNDIGGLFEELVAGVTKTLEDLSKALDSFDFGKFLDDPSTKLGNFLDGVRSWVNDHQTELTELGNSIVKAVGSALSFTGNAGTTFLANLAEAFNFEQDDINRAFKNNSFATGLMTALTSSMLGASPLLSILTGGGASLYEAQKKIRDELFGEFMEKNQGIYNERDAQEYIEKNMTDRLLKSIGLDAGDLANGLIGFADTAIDAIAPKAGSLMGKLVNAIFGDGTVDMSIANGTNREAAEAFAGSLGTFVASVIGSIKNGNSFQDAVKRVTGNTLFGTLISSIIGGFEHKDGGIEIDWEAVGVNLVEVGNTFINMISSAIKGVKNIGQTIFTAIGEALSPKNASNDQKRTIAGRLGNYIKELGEENSVLGNAITVGAAGWFASGSLLGGIISGIASAIEELSNDPNNEKWTKLQEDINGFWDTLSKILFGESDDSGKYSGGLIQKLGELFGGIWEAISPKLQPLWEGIKNGVRQLGEDLLSMISPYLSYLGFLLQGWLDNFLGKNGLIEWVAEQFGYTPKNGKTWVIGKDGNVTTAEAMQANGASPTEIAEALNTRDNPVIQALEKNSGLFKTGENGELLFSPLSENEEQFLKQGAGAETISLFNDLISRGRYKDAADLITGYSDALLYGRKLDLQGESFDFDAETAKEPFSEINEKAKQIITSDDLGKRKHAEYESLTDTGIRGPMTEESQTAVSMESKIEDADNAAEVHDNAQSDMDKQSPIVMKTVLDTPEGTGSSRGQNEGGSASTSKTQGTENAQASTGKQVSETAGTQAYEQQTASEAGKPPVKTHGKEGPAASAQNITALSTGSVQEPGAVIGEVSPALAAIMSGAETRTEKDKNGKNVRVFSFDSKSASVLGKDAAEIIDNIYDQMEKAGVDVNNLEFGEGKKAGTIEITADASEAEEILGKFLKEAENSHVNVNIGAEPETSGSASAVGTETETSGSTPTTGPETDEGANASAAESGSRNSEQKPTVTTADVDQWKKLAEENPEVVQNAVQNHKEEIEKYKDLFVKPEKSTPKTPNSGKTPTQNIASDPRLVGMQGSAGVSDVRPGTRAEAGTQATEPKTWASGTETQTRTGTQTGTVAQAGTGTQPAAGGQRKIADSDFIPEGYSGSANLLNRPTVSGTKMREAGWDVNENDYATLLSQTFSAGNVKQGYDLEYDQNVVINMTPITPEGSVLTPEELDQYIYDLVEKSAKTGESIEDLDAGEYKLVLGIKPVISDESLDAAYEKAEEWTEKLHIFQDLWNQFREGLTGGQGETITLDTTAEEAEGEVSGLIREIEKAFEYNGETINVKLKYSLDETGLVPENIAELFGITGSSVETPGGDSGKAINGASAALSESVSGAAEGASSTIAGAIGAAVSGAAGVLNEAAGNFVSGASVAIGEAVGEAIGRTSGGKNTGKAGTDAAKGLAAAAGAAQGAAGAMSGISGAASGVSSALSSLAGKIESIEFPADKENALGGRFASEQNHMTVAEDGTEYIIPITKPARAMDLIFQMLSEMGYNAIQKVLGHFGFDVSGSGSNEAAASAIYNAGASFSERLDKDFGLGTIGTIGNSMASMNAAMQNMSTVYNYTISAPVSINVQSSGASAEEIGTTAYNLAERHLLKNMRGVYA